MTPGSADLRPDFVEADSSKVAVRLLCLLQSMSPDCPKPTSEVDVLGNPY